MSHLLSRLRLRLLPLLSVLLLLGCTSNPFRSQIPAEAATDRSPVGSEAPEYSAGAAAIPETHSERDTPPPADLWERIRRGQRLEIPNHPRVHRQLEWLAANSRYLEHTAQRAEPYLYFIVEEAERRGLPLELALIPAVESGFQPRVRSPLQAAGLWQFMPSTAKGLGLKRSWWYEGRCDITSSTGAALDYLQNLADQFDGDWELALAAYNAGPGTVRKAIRRNRERRLPNRFARSFEPSLAAGKQCDSRPTFCQKPRSGQSDSARRPGDDSDLSIHSSAHASSQTSTLHSTRASISLSANPSASRNTLRVCSPRSGPGRVIDTGAESSRIPDCSNISSPSRPCTNSTQCPRAAS
jgi:hypothetical protein